MSSQSFGLGSFRFAGARKRRIPFLRFFLGLLGLAVLCLLLVFGFFIGAAMLIVGFTVKKLLSKRKAPTPLAADVSGSPSFGKAGAIEGEYRVVR